LIAKNHTIWQKLLLRPKTLQGELTMNTYFTTCKATGIGSKHTGICWDMRLDESDRLSGCVGQRNRATILSPTNTTINNGSSHETGYGNQHVVLFGSINHRRTPIGRFLTWTSATIRYAREWLADCSWADVDSETIMDETEVTGREVIRNVRRSWDGGLSAFLHCVAGDGIDNGALSV
jgi:hypothetical protein